MRSDELVVTMEDGEGQEIINEDLSTFDNGFIGLWLPRGIAGTIEITHDDGFVTAPISTGYGDPTCITTLRLEAR